MSLRIILGLVIVCAGRRAVAERAVRVAVAPAVPFDEAELSAALQLRLPDGEPIAIDVAPIAGGVRITVGAEVRDVALDGLRGAEAARLVALATTDLFDADIAAVPVVAPALASPAMTPAIAAHTTPRSPVTVEVLGTAAAWDDVLAGAAIGLAVPRGPWVATVEIGGGGLVDAPIGMIGGAIRMGGGRRFDWLDLRATVIVAPLAVSSGAGDLTALVGAGASARLRVPVTRRVRGVIGAGLDGFANRTTYVASGAVVVQTPWLAPWLAAGIEVTP
ncbi:MAG: hypothetical protein K8W52_34280 [Deltaproteobacteria bacterium]|nr:hypothetical protein [Deltaproteobacteria bacterium]